MHFSFLCFYYNDIINFNGIFIHFNDVPIKKYLQGDLKRSEHPLSCSLQAVCQQNADYRQQLAC